MGIFSHFFNFENGTKSWKESQIIINMSRIALGTNTLTLKIMHYN